MTLSNCNKCNGSGRLVCYSCHNNPEGILCYRCRGKANFTCLSCNGAGLFACKACFGKGYLLKRRPPGGLWPETCRKCGGQGRNGCRSCGGQGFKLCSHCNGYRHLRCNRCGGIPPVCPKCGGSGKYELPTRYIESKNEYPINGIVKFFDQSRGFGFIQPDNNTPDVYVHSKNLIGTSTLNQGDKVEFAIRDGAKGPWAINVKKKDG